MYNLPSVLILSDLADRVLVLLELMSQGEKGSGDGGVLLASVVDVTKEGFRFQER